MYPLLLHSVQQKEKVIMVYIDQQDNITQRTVQVVTIKSDSILAFCYFRKEIRLFHLDQILSVGKSSGRVRYGA
ncbi:MULTISPECIES: hypothetical protein [Oceanobacillus]|uniref:WYL domain-containing protein n=1 Tax=Oceanobacillus kimchii TaxID=746691 RepID=A0ABQ5TLJ9_9BACI|nr:MULTISPECIES: hypothetical protein [Oceanobacillus]MBT2600736.1 hypothetical protein [Oceanobacillus sp. ISL-74]MBT2650867.1 hypothetical protein [Oceanobacillus sp. ISL-73]MCT1575491.1 WYL domain-containing protein [Oceanobacillus kimchii]MCT2138064.1 WYL domain-containing protein [Oceanobacillus kimchii]GLO66930.1 hypothetical protein MACH08_27140 [Oceanobacillus kimchii]